MADDAAWIEEEGRRTPVMASVDVLVAGAGSAGVAAAIAAAETGAKTLLVDAEGAVGGTLANQLLEHSAGYLNAQGDPIVAGVGQRIIDRLRQVGASPGHQPDDSGFQGGRTPVNHAELKLVQAVMLDEAGVRLMLRSPVVAVARSGEKIDAVVMEGKSGRYAVRAPMFVDCTGDADLCALAGCAFQSDKADKVQAASMLFKLGGIDFRALLAYASSHPGDFLEGSVFPDAGAPYVTLWGFGELIARGHAAGLLSVLRPELHFGGWPARGEAIINFTRVGAADALDAGFAGKVLPALSRQVLEFARFFREMVPGCANVYVVDVASRVGIRESRRVRGIYTLDYQDVMRGARFTDAIAQCAHPIDIHADATNSSNFEKLEGTHDIPYRCLVPVDTPNLLVAGRCVSSTHEAQGAIRGTAQCFAMGEAAGTAAAMCVRQSCEPRELEYARLRSALLERGVLLHGAD